MLLLVLMDKLCKMTVYTNRMMKVIKSNQDRSSSPVEYYYRSLVSNHVGVLEVEVQVVDEERAR